MELGRFIRRLLGIRGRSSRRQAALDGIEEMGFKLVDLRGWHDGKHATRRYHLIDPNGKVMDNNGEGYYSTSSAYRAAEEASKTIAQKS